LQVLVIMPNNNQRANAVRHGRTVPHDEKQATLVQCVTRHEDNANKSSSPTQATETNPFKRTLDNEESDERQAARKAIKMYLAEDANNDMPAHPRWNAKQSIDKDLPVLVVSTHTDMISGSKPDDNQKSIITTNDTDIKKEQVSGVKKDSKIQHISDSAKQQTEDEGSDIGNFDNSDDAFVVNLFEQSNDGRNSARGYEVEEFDSEDEKSIMNNLAKRYGEDNIFDNSDEEAITGRFCYEDGPICPN